ncbi:hypothetical protein MRX96_041225, partial [Rhipicephalus microplus]
MIIIAFQTDTAKLCFPLQCLNQTLNVCQNGSQATDQMVLSTINTITCLLTSVVAANPGTSTSGLTCLIARLIQNVPGLNLLTFFLSFLTSG